MMKLMLFVIGWVATVMAVALLRSKGEPQDSLKLESSECCAAVDDAAAKGSYVTAKTQTCCSAKLRVALAALSSFVSGCAGCQNPNPGPVATGGSSSISTGGSTSTGGRSGTGGGSPLSKVDKACQNMLGKCPEVKDFAACVATIKKINAGRVGNFDDNTLDCLGSAKTQKDVQNCKGPVCGGVN